MELDHSSLANNQTGITAETMAVKTSAAMFEVMYSSLYERKEEAVLRELAANALDESTITDWDLQRQLDMYETHLADLHGDRT